SGFGTTMVSLTGGNPVNSDVRRFRIPTQDTKMKLVFVTLLVFPLVGGVFSRWQKKEGPDLDQQVLDQLKAAGSDLSKPHSIDFFLYFPSEDAAKQAAKDIEGDVDTVKVELGAEKRTGCASPTSEWFQTTTNLWRYENISTRSLTKATASMMGGEPKWLNKDTPNKIVAREPRERVSHEALLVQGSRYRGRVNSAVR